MLRTQPLMQTTVEGFDLKLNVSVIFILSWCDRAFTRTHTHTYIKVHNINQLNLLIL